MKTFVLVYFLFFSPEGTQSMTVAGPYSYDECINESGAVADVFYSLQNVTITEMDCVHIESSM